MRRERGAALTPDQRWAWLLVAAVCGGLGWIVATREQPMAPPAAATIVAPPLVDVAAQTLDGAAVRLGDQRGQVILLNLWATWCPPCRAEMPLIQAAYEQYRDAGFTVLAVSQGEEAATVAAYVREAGLTFPVWLDAAGAAGRAYQVRALPASIFIGRDGTVRAVYRGPLSRSVIDGTVVPLLAEPGGS
jgi:thiol-disulfide isomerase/thioredoxin